MRNLESCAGVRRHALSQVRTLAHLGSHVAVEHAGKRHGCAVGAASQAHRRDDGVPVLHARPPTCHTGRGWEKVQTKPQSQVQATESLGKQSSTARGAAPAEQRMQAQKLTLVLSHAKVDSQGRLPGGSAAGRPPASQSLEHLCTP